MKTIEILIVEDEAFSHGMMHKLRQGHNCGPLLKRIGFVLTLMLSLMLTVKPSDAQDSFPSPGKLTLKMDREEVCWKSSPLPLSEDQIKALENLRRAYASETMPLRREIMSLRFELRHFIRDPNVEPKVLLDWQKRISELQTKLDNLSLSYQIKTWSIFTKEQLERLPQDCSLSMELGAEMGIGKIRGSRKKPR